MTAALSYLRLPTSPPTDHEQPLSSLPLTVLVGVTGVGKSTALSALNDLSALDNLSSLDNLNALNNLGALASLKILPDRREITDAVIILPLAGKAVSDREQRFALSAQYRQTHPGGMAQALGPLLADTRHWGHSPVFDGLRGLAEVQYAAEHYPSWRFIALGAPDLVRVRRLLGRSDSFDKVQTGAAADLSQALSNLKGVSEVFSADQLSSLARLTTEGHAPSDVLAKVKIVVSERQNYDPQAAEAYLRTLPAGRALILDTVALSAEQVAAAVQEWK